ncbi:hypothetical protein DL98DRAFT_631805 [Cadophora sp. DSE1049]|nr:hypothetical protein DL98DRAFT_631805 [Cadophora sp. DSE1049]
MKGGLPQFRGLKRLDIGVMFLYFVFVRRAFCEQKIYLNSIDKLRRLATFKIANLKPQDYSFSFVIERCC